jgi:hypothetical protein
MAPKDPLHETGTPAETGGAGAAGGADEIPDALRRLEVRLDKASAAAERLIAEAGEHAAARITGRPPPSGWQRPPADPGSHSEQPLSGDVELLSQLMRSVRDLIPPELERRLADALRELLMAVRALLDWYIERLDQRRTEPDEVEDIPIL